MIRELTELEQLQWYKQYLEDQIRLYQEELEQCEKDLEKVKVLENEKNS